MWHQHQQPWINPLWTIISQYIVQYRPSPDARFLCISWAAYAKYTLQQLSLRSVHWSLVYYWATATFKKLLCQSCEAFEGNSGHVWRRLWMGEWAEWPISSRWNHQTDTLMFRRQLTRAAPMMTNRTSTIVLIFTGLTSWRHCLLFAPHGRWWAKCKWAINVNKYECITDQEMAERCCI